MKVTASSNTNQVKLAVVSGSRADYGLLLPVMKALAAHAQFDLKIIVTGMHLDKDFGETYKIFAQDDLHIDAKVNMLSADDSEIGITRSIGDGISKFADTLASIKPDLLLVLGDRFEIFAAVQAALIARIPVAHIAGGDSTEGAYDEAIRHSISKMSHLHFTTNEVAKRRVIQLGENPDYVFNVGSPGLDLIRQTKLMSKAELETSLNIALQDTVLAVTLHPTTLDFMPVTEQCQILFSALDSIDKDTSLIFTKANADNDGRKINSLIDEYVATHNNAYAFTSLGQQRYYSLVALSNAVIGNSSSGLYEAPSLGTATVNIGIRQQGRIKSSSVFDCDWDKNEIQTAIKQAMEMDMNGINNPYGDGHSTDRIKNVLSQYNSNNLRALIQKPFFDIEFDIKTDIKIISNKILNTGGIA